MIAAMAKKSAGASKGQTRYVTFSIHQLRGFAADLRETAASLDAVIQRAIDVQMSEVRGIDGGAKLELLIEAADDIYGKICGVVATAEQAARRRRV